jgi:ribosomal protein L11 methyltransferase
MSWTEIVIEIARDHAEALSEALMEAGALSVSVEDADEGTDAGETAVRRARHGADRSGVGTQPRGGPDRRRCRPGSHRGCRSGAAIGLPSVPKFTTRKVEDEDWVRLTQSQFEPIHIGKNIWVVPSWHEAPDLRR